MSKKVNFDKFVRPESDYGKAVAWMIQKKIYTYGELLSFVKSIKKGKKTSASVAAVGVLLSPRENSDRNGCDSQGRGSYSNSWGHVAYNEKMERRWVGGKREVQRYRFCIRTKPLKSRKRSDVSAIASKKIATQAKTKTKATNTVKV